jgi:hypothetical protein
MITDTPLSAITPASCQTFTPLLMPPIRHWPLTLMITPSYSADMLIFAIDRINISHWLILLHNIATYYAADASPPLLTDAS